LGLDGLGNLLHRRRLRSGIAEQVLRRHHSQEGAPVVDHQDLGLAGCRTGQQAAEKGAKQVGLAALAVAEDDQVGVAGRQVQVKGAEVPL
jgi:hypothetical protein